MARIHTLTLVVSLTLSTSLAAQRNAAVVPELHGTVHDAEGAPVMNAVARLVPLDATDGRQLWVDDDFTDEDGRFSLSAPAAGSYVVYANSLVVGDACSEPFALAADAAVPPVELVLGSRISLRGRAVDPSGARVAGVELFALPSVLSPRMRASTECGSRSVVNTYGGFAIADETGVFVFEELAATTYDLYASWGKGPGVRDFACERSWRPLGQVDVAAGESDTTVVVAARRIEVTVYRSDGTRASSISGAKVSPLGGAFFGPMESTVVGESLLVALVEPDTDYVVTSTSSTVPLRELIVRRDDSRWLRRIDLQLPERADPSPVIVSVTDPDGVPLAHVGVSIFTAKSNLPIRKTGLGQFGMEAFAEHENLTITRIDVEGDDSSHALMSLTLPPGRYVVRASQDPTEASEGTLEARATFASTRVPITVSRDRPTWIEVPLVHAGYLDLRSDGSTDSPTKADVREANPWSLRGIEARAPIGVGRASLASPTGEWRDDLRFDYDEDDGEARGVRWVVPGWPLRCVTPIPVGTWTFRVEDRDRILFERDVVIEEGRTTLVHW